MKRILIIAALAITATTLGAAPCHAGGAVGVTIGSGGFTMSVGSGTWAIHGNSWYDPAWSVDFDVALNGYGDWIFVEGLGRVWRPWVTTEWRPFTHGRWTWTLAGWTWVAYEPWGWAPHHFGRWANSGWGWVWIPDYDWHPGDVTWVQRGNYVGWFPRPPQGWSHTHMGWDYGYQTRHPHRHAVGWDDARHATWVEWRHFSGSSNIARHVVSPNVALRHASAQSTRLAMAPPTPNELRRRTGSVIHETKLEHRTVIVSGRAVRVARAKGSDDDFRRNADQTTREVLTTRAATTRITRAAPKAISPARGTASSSSTRYEPQARQTNAAPQTTQPSTISDRRATKPWPVTQHPGDQRSSTSSRSVTPTRRPTEKAQTASTSARTNSERPARRTTTVAAPSSPTRTSTANTSRSARRQTTTNRGEAERKTSRHREKPESPTATRSSGSRTRR